MYRKLFLIFSFLFSVFSLSIQAHAKGVETEKELKELTAVKALKAVSVIEVANFFCPRCYEIEQYADSIEKLVKSTGGEYVFSPVYFGKYSKWPTLAYYSDLSIISGIKKQSREALFLAAVSSGDKLADDKSVCQVLSDHIPVIQFKRCLKKVNASYSAYRSMKSLKLLDYLITQGYLGEVIKFPVFIIESNKEIKVVLSAEDTEDMLSLSHQVKELVRRYADV